MTTRSLLSYGSTTSKANFMYLELVDLPKLINTKLNQGEETYSNFSFSQVLVYIQKYMVPKPFTKYHDRKPKAVILVPTPTNSALKYLSLLLKHPSN